MRLFFLLLLLANVAAFGYIRYAESRSGADTQNALLQISPEKMKLLKPGRKEQTAALPKSPPQPSLACLEWGGFGAEDATPAAAALAGLGLGDNVSRRDPAGWWVYLPPLKTKSDADAAGNELKARGVTDFYLIQDDSEWRFAVSLGVFGTEAAANSYLAQLRQKGVRLATAGPRGVRSTTFVIRDPGDAIAARIAELQTGFPNTQLKATACADARTAKTP